MSATKEAIAIVLDVSKSMNLPFRGSKSGITRLQAAIDSIKMLIEQKLLYTKGTEIGIVLFGSDVTNNPINDKQGGYENVNMIMYMDEPSIDLLKTIDSQITASKTVTGDWIDGLIVLNKYNKRIFLITDGESDVKDSDQIQDIVDQLIQTDTSVNVIAIDFCNHLNEESDDESTPSNKKSNHDNDSDDQDDDNKPNGDAKRIKVEQNQGEMDLESAAQTENTKIIENFTSKIKGAIFPAKLAISIFKQFQKKEVTKRTKYRGALELAKDCDLEVCVYTKTTEEKLPGLKKHSLCVDPSDDVKSGEVTREVFYADVDDPEKKEIDAEDVIKAYFYGKQLVPIDKINEEVLKFNDDRCLKMLGFTNASNVPRQHYMSGCDIVVPVESANNRRAFSALIHAMLDTDTVMIAKWVSRKNAAPKLVVLHPYYAPKFECLYMNVLPTVEDIRDYQFGSLVESTPAQQKAMDEFVDALDIDEAEEEDAEAESNVFNPTLQYFNQCVIHRIYNGEDSSLPELNRTIEEHARPEGGAFQRAQQQVEELTSAFELEENKEEAKRNERRVCLRDIVLQGQNEEEKKEEITAQVDSTAAQTVPEFTAEEKQRKFDFNKEEKIDKISSMNPVKDFEKMINDREEDRVEDALKQMKAIILEFIKHSIQGDIYEKAIECLKSMRKACKENDEPQPFNDFLKELRNRYETGIHSSFYEMIRTMPNEIGLITKDESFKSNVTKQESDDFFGIVNQQPDNAKNEENVQKNNGDIFDELD